jgi:hypothetical protein
MRPRSLAITAGALAAILATSPVAAASRISSATCVSTGTGLTVTATFSGTWVGGPAVSFSNSKTTWGNGDPGTMSVTDGTRETWVRTIGSYYRFAKVRRTVSGSFPDYVYEEKVVGCR